MTRFRWPQLAVFSIAVASSLGMSGCAHSLSSWIVATRDHQGARSLEVQRYKDAAHAFRLALAIDPDDTQARDGFIEAQTGLAQTFYQSSEFQEALSVLQEARQVSPQNVRIAALTADISSARIKSEIVHSNYAAYKETSDALLRGYAQLKLPETEVAYRIKRFGYTYDTTDLTRAIRSSNDLMTDITKLTTHLVQLRTLVAAGAGAAEPAGGNTSTNPNSLLPLP